MYRKLRRNRAPIFYITFTLTQPAQRARRKIYKEVNKMAKIELKKPVIEEISAAIKDAQSVVLVDYRGLTVEQDTELRKQLREAGINLSLIHISEPTRPY